jgi:hypothetical protein
MPPKNKTRVHKRLLTPRPPGIDQLRIPHLAELLDTYTNEQFKTSINNLPDSWQDINDKGTIVTKRQLKMATWGEYKDDHSALLFQTTILNTRPHPHTATQYDTLLAQSVVTHNDVWTRRITNPLRNEQLHHPVQNKITIMQVYNSYHYTTLITDNNKYYHYDGLKMEVSEQATLLHNHLRQWYGTSEKPPVL